MTTAAEDRIAAIRHCVMDQGLSFDATAKALGLSLWQVMYSAKAGGVAGQGRRGRPPLPLSEKKVKYGPFRPHGGPRLSHEQRERKEKIIAFLREGVACAAVGARFGVTKQHVQQIAKKAGVSYPDMRHNRGDNKKERNESIIALLREDVTCEAIGKRFGVSRQRIHQIATKAGIALPSSWKVRRAENKRLLRAKRDAEAKRVADVRQKVLDHGLTFRAAARVLGMSPAQVEYTAKMIGIKSPQSPQARKS